MPANDVTQFGRQRWPRQWRHGRGPWPTCVRTALLLPAFLPLTAAVSPQTPAPESGNSSSGVSFVREIAPILAQKCVGCHGPKKMKGGYQTHTFESLMTGGESKAPPIIAGQPARSRLFQLISTNDVDERMPQKDDPLPQATVALIGRWIREGAQFDGPDAKAWLLSYLPRTPHPDPPEAYPRPIPIRALAFSPNGRELAVGGYHEITLWSPGDGKLLRRIKNVAQQTQSLAFHPGGRWLAAGGGSPGQSGEVTLFDAVTGAVVKTLATTADVALAVAFNPDGSRLAAGGADNMIRVFDTATGNQELVIEQHADWIVGLAWNPDGTRIASASRDKTARIFASRDGDLESTYVGHGEPVFAIAFSPDGKRVYTAGRDKKLHLWEPKDAQKIDEAAIAEGDVYRLIAHSNSLFSCSADMKVRHHLVKGKKVETASVFSGHADFVYALAYHEPTGRLASGSFDGEVRVWNVVEQNLVTAFTAAPGYRPTGLSALAPDAVKTNPRKEGERN